MTAPERAHDSPYGRVYLAASVDFLNEKPTWASIQAGTWVPSVTNVIDVAGKPFLKQWAARLAAEAAVGAAFTHHTQMVNRPRAAATWAANAAVRYTSEAAELGDLVHTLCEERSKGATPEVPAHAEPYMKSWEQFMADFAPTFTGLEATVYGGVPTSDAIAGFAGTADFFATINGIPLVGDYKSGRYVHDSAALQLAAEQSTVVRIEAQRGLDVGDHLLAAVRVLDTCRHHLLLEALSLEAGEVKVQGIARAVAALH